MDLNTLLPFRRWRARGDARATRRLPHDVEARAKAAPPTLEHPTQPKPKAATDVALVVFSTFFDASRGPLAAAIFNDLADPAKVHATSVRPSVQVQRAGRQDGHRGRLGIRIAIAEVLFA